MRCNIFVKLLRRQGAHEAAVQAGNATGKTRGFDIVSAAQKLYQKCSTESVAATDDVHRLQTADGRHVFVQHLVARTIKQYRPAAAEGQMAGVDKFFRQALAQVEEICL